jgi:hypothetical protein
MTQRPNAQIDRFGRQVMYSLKRQWGAPIDLYRLTGEAVTDLDTGLKVVPKEVHPIRRAIVLPAKIMREVLQSISQISANKSMVYGGSFDSAARVFIIDQRDIPEVGDTDIREDDWIVYKGHRYEIKQIEEFDLGGAWMITGKRTYGSTHEQIFPLVTDSYLDLNGVSEQS